MGETNSIEDFSFVAGSLSLDFANTLEWVDGEIDVEWLHSYDDLLAWCLRAGCVTADEAEVLARHAARKPDAAAAAYAKALSLRALIQRLFTALAVGDQPTSDDLAQLNQHVQVVMPLRQLVQSSEGYSWEWAGDADALERPLWALVYAAAELLTSPQIALLRQCGADDCSWLFLDTSRNRHRRWCDMETCGNRAKARRHYAKQRGAEV
jgi:predicted RNA-binding Zn ribbon-like protein